MDTILILGIVFIFFSYFLIGSWPVGRLMGRAFANVEVESAGSGKAGATNVIRTTGDKLLGFVVGFVDATIKGTLWIFIVYLLFSVILHAHAWVVYACFAAVLLGHIFPVLTRFKNGGAGIATSIGGMLVLAPGLAYALAIAVWLIVFHFSKGVRFICNIAAAVTLFVVGLFFKFSPPFLIFVVFATALILFAHRQNFSRWRKGQEGKNTWNDLWKSVQKPIPKGLS